MTKPCRHTEYKSGCRICELAETDDGYRQLWEMKPLGRKILPPAKGCLGCGKRKPVHLIECTALGIGDHCLVLTAACGLAKDKPNVDVVVVPHFYVGAAVRPWMDLFSGNYRIEMAKVPAAVTYKPHETYTQQNEERRYSRAEYYARACDTTPVLPRVKPLPVEAIEWASQYGDELVLLSPFCSQWKNRDYPLALWLKLEQRLIDEGYRVVIIDSDADRVKEFASVKVIGETPVRVAALMNRGVVIGNDSGMVHIAGLLGCRGIALCGAVNGSSLFGLYDKVKWIDGHLPCSGCRWQKGLGFLEACNDGCFSLGTITADEILRCLHGMAFPPSLLSQDRLSTIKAAVESTCHLDGVMAELGVFWGGSAEFISGCCPGKELHLFDNWGSGLPFQDENGFHKVGEFNADIGVVRDRLAGRKVVFHSGVFPSTFRGLDGLRFSFVHIDCDVAASVLQALKFVVPRMQKSGVLIIDDFEWERTPGVVEALREYGILDRVERVAFIQGMIKF